MMFPSMLCCKLVPVQYDQYQYAIHKLIRGSIRGSNVWRMRINNSTKTKIMKHEALYINDR